MVLLPCKQRRQARQLWSVGIHDIDCLAINSSHYGVQENEGGFRSHQSISQVRASDLRRVEELSRDVVREKEGRLNGHAEVRKVSKNGMLHHQAVPHARGGADFSSSSKPDGNWSAAEDAASQSPAKGGGTKGTSPNQQVYEDRRYFACLHLANAINGLLAQCYSSDDALSWWNMLYAHETNENRPFCSSQGRPDGVNYPRISAPMGTAAARGNARTPWPRRGKKTPGSFSDTSADHPCSVRALIFFGASPLRRVPPSQVLWLVSMSSFGHFGKRTW